MAIPDWNSPQHDPLKHDLTSRSHVANELAAATTASDALAGMNQSQLDAADDEVDRIRLAIRRLEFAIRRRPRHLSFDDVV